MPSPTTCSSTSNRLDTSLRKLVVDLKLDLAEALAKLDDLTLANQRLARERDEARREVRRLRRSQYMYQHHIRSNRDVQQRRASDGGAPSLRTIDEGRSSSLRNILSGLHDEVAPIDHHGDGVHALASPPPSSSYMYSIADRTSSHASDDQQGADATRAGTPYSRSLDELQRRYDDISLDGGRRNPGRNVAETDKAAGLPQIRQKVAKLSATSAMDQHQEEDSAPPGEEEEEVCNETYHEYTAETNFSGSISPRNQERGRSKRRLVSELQIAQAKIAFGDESI